MYLIHYTHSRIHSLHLNRRLKEKKENFEKNENLMGWVHLVITFSKRPILSLIRVLLSNSSLVKSESEISEWVQVPFMFSSQNQNSKGADFGWLYQIVIPKGQLISKQNCRYYPQCVSFVFWEKLRLDNFVSRLIDL